MLLAALFLPARDPVTHSLAAEWRPSAELAGLLFLIAMAALASPRLIAGRGFAFVLALLVVGAALLNLADAVGLHYFPHGPNATRPEKLTGLA